MVQKSLKANRVHKKYLEDMKRLEDEIFNSMRAEYDEHSIERFASFQDHLPFHQFKYEEKNLGRRVLSKLFGHKAKRPNRECEAMENFVWTLRFNARVYGCERDLTPKQLKDFMQDMNLCARDLQFLWIEMGRLEKEEPDLEFEPVLRKKGDKWQFSWKDVVIQQHLEWKTYDKEKRLYEVCME